MKLKVVLSILCIFAVFSFFPQHIQSTSLSGDANNDGRVDGVDYVVWLSHYNQNVAGSGSGDFDNSGRVDGLDYVIWLNNYETVQFTPTTTQTSTPSRAPTSSDNSAIWQGDADTNGMTAWKEIQCPSGNSTIENDPEGKYGKVYRVYLNTGDIYSGDGKARCEYYGSILSNGQYLKYYDGDDYYFGWRTRVSDGIYTNSGNSGNFIQLKGDSSCGGPAVGLTMENGNLTLRSELYGIFWNGPKMTAFTGKWHDIVLHVYFSKNATRGFVEAWLDGVAQTFKDGSKRYYIATMCPDDSYIYLKMGYYRGSNTQFPPGTHWFDSLRLGLTYNSVVPR